MKTTRKANKSVRKFFPIQWNYNQRHTAPLGLLEIYFSVKPFHLSALLIHNFTPETSNSPPTIFILCSTIKNNSKSKTPEIH